MNIFEMIKSLYNVWTGEGNFDYKWFMTKIDFRLFADHFSDKIEATTHAIAHDPTFWISGAALVLLILVSNAKCNEEAVNA
ncbi:hypothetical protein KNT87_gp079 [Erwinia phage Cronus]|uniref:Uncharacterized protein n=1 Tax=Erwinia phage Cronus TaxID=2163633 RepID=A0A2S1GMA3_9CAUD|nr:hypothetical protein KNT87_gp079 [Erwinia phage Cronus]AWD90518.1 hypothetical protein [Erwinia phage Cronus]